MKGKIVCFILLLVISGGMLFVLHSYAENGVIQDINVSFHSAPVGEILENVQITQSFTADNDGLASVEIMFATFARQNECTVSIVLSELGSGKTVFQSQLAGTELADNSFHSFSFEPQASKNKEYIISVISDAKESNGVTIWSAGGDVYPGGECMINDIPTYGDICFKTYFMPGSKIGLSVILPCFILFSFFAGIAVFYKKKNGITAFIACLIYAAAAVLSGMHAEEDIRGFLHGSFYLAFLYIVIAAAMVFGLNCYEFFCSKKVIVAAVIKKTIRIAITVLILFAIASLFKLNTITDGSSGIYYTANISAFITLISVIAAAILFEKKIGYFAKIISIIRKEGEFLKKLEKKGIKCYLRIFSDFGVLLYIVCFLALVMRGITDKKSILFFGVFSTVVLIVVLADKIVNNSRENPAKIFLMISLISCMMMSYCMPINVGISWDDQIHYNHAVCLKNMLFDKEYTIADEDMKQIMTPFSVYIDSPINTDLQMLNKDEKILNQFNMFVNPYTYIGYLPAATSMFICDLFNINFVSMIVISKFVNGLVYSFVVYSGMKKLKSGQYILSSIALMPTCLFLASVFSYDYWVNAFIMYSFAYLISELQQPDKQLSVKDAVLMLGSMFIGCGPKAIYFAMLLPFLFAQKSKFKGKFSYKHYAAAVCAAACIIAASFALPMLIGGVGSDMRGGEGVNGPEQVRFILTHPLDYTVILLRYMNIYTSVGNLNGWFNSFAYLGSNAAECSTVTFILLVLAAFWDKSECDKFKHMLAFKLTTYFTLFVQVALICTALYISFTPVASESIGGVQGRYLFPLLFPFLYCLGSAHTKTAISSKFMNSLIFGGCTLNIIWCTYSVYITQIIK